MSRHREPAFTLGVEEEYLLIDPVSRDLASDPPAQLLEQCQGLLASRVSPEFMRCQIEVGTPVCDTVAEARQELAHLRRTVAEIAHQYNLGLIAASTHPFATWRPQKTTERERYEQLEHEIGTPVRRLLICAMHVHIGIEDPNLRIDLMNQMRYFLPHLLVLSTSSPFWQGEDTKLKSYRLSVFNELPRTGIPDAYISFGEYEQHLAALVQTGVIQDGTKIWWDIRPSARFPTLEMRICDICTRLEDTIAIVALYLCLTRMLWRLKRTNISWRRYKTFLIHENRWRAQRYGFDSGLIDFGRREMVPYAELLEEILELIHQDAEALDCVAEVSHARTIVQRGTSAHNQLRIFNEARAAGADRWDAMRQVVDWLSENTLDGV